MDRYERLKTLGRGAFGVASLVRERAAHPGGSPGPLRVIKEVDLGQLPPASRKEAQKEVIVLARFKHPNIVEYHTAFIDVEKQTLCIVMEFADGGDLAAAVRQRRDDQRRFSEGDALVIFAQCLEALVHIHSKHVLHRDIKCQNIFATKSGAVKLGDFGIAKVLEHTASAAKTMIGTPNYLAPEVCENVPYNDRADIWSMGVVFYELLALQQPFQAYNMAALVLKIVTGEPAPLPPEYSPEVVEITQRTLQKKPEMRPSAVELLNLPVVRCRVGSRFQLADSGCSRSGLKTPSVLHAGNTYQFSGNHGSPQVGRSPAASDAVDELRYQFEAQAQPTECFDVHQESFLPREQVRLSQESLPPREQARLSQEMLSPQEQARLNKMRVQGTPLTRAPFDMGEQDDMEHQATRDTQQNPWDWQNVSAQAELERKRNKERLTKQNWRGPGLGFLGGNCYEHTPVGTTGAQGWQNAGEPCDAPGTRPEGPQRSGRAQPGGSPAHTRHGTPPGSTSGRRSTSSSALGVAGGAISVVQRLRPSPLAGSGAGTEVPSPGGQVSRLAMGSRERPDSMRSSKRSSPRIGSRPSTGVGTDVVVTSDCSSPASVATRPHTGSSVGGQEPARGSRYASLGHAAQRASAEFPAGPEGTFRGSSGAGGTDARWRSPSARQLPGRPSPSGSQPPGRQRSKPAGAVVSPAGAGRAGAVRPGSRSRRPASRQAAELAPRPEPHGPDLADERHPAQGVGPGAPAAAPEPAAAAAAPVPTPAALAERFAWASRFADAKLDMQLPAYADRRGAEERLGELDSLFSEIARITDGKPGADREKPVTSSGGSLMIEGGKNTFLDGDATEDWDGAETFNDADPFTQPMLKSREVTASQMDVLAAAIRA